ncbi:MAG: hypothetical protein MJ224_05910 [archaeon]|nr:hypothetical protein [archaeon]
MKKNNKYNFRAANFKIAEKHYNDIKKLIEDGQYINHSEFYREAVRYRLETLQKLQMEKRHY